LDAAGRHNVDNDGNQDGENGTMKALGAPSRKIIGIYLSQYCAAAFIGSLAGCVLAIFICDFIIEIFSSMFVVPSLAFAIYPPLWLAAILVSLLLCALSGLAALFSILPLLPAGAMRPRIPKGGRHILLERIGFLGKLSSFNTRYALKSTTRNKGRFVTIILGMCGSCALIAFSLGFYDSIDSTKEKYFGEFANYDVIVNIEPTPLAVDHPVQEQLDESRKALTTHVKIRDEYYLLVIVESNFDMVNIPQEELKNGLIVPEYFAEQWDVRPGDILETNGMGAVVSAVVPQHLGLTLFTGYDYVSRITDEIPAAYNALYGRSGDIPGLTAYLKDSGAAYSTIDDDRNSFGAIMKSMSVLIWFMISASLVLGFTVLYSVGLINLSEREYEYMFMGVMGYPRKSILSAHIKEAVLHLAVAIPAGFIIGNLILEMIKGEFSGTNFVISAAIFPQSYILAALSVIGITALMALVTSHHIGRLDIVEGLKAQDN
jgi:putative ABC transport system permease protein